MVALFLIAEFFLTGCLFVGISIPLVQRRIKPNSWYGFRVNKTLRDPDVWYAVNACAGRRMVVVGAVTTAASLLLAPLFLLHDFGMPAYVLIWTSLMLGGVLWSTLSTFRYLGRF